MQPEMCWPCKIEKKTDQQKQVDRLYRDFESKEVVIKFPWVIAGYFLLTVETIIGSYYEHLTHREPPNYTNQLHLPGVIITMLSLLFVFWACSKLPKLALYAC